MTTFALFYGNRAFMPDETIDLARPQLEKAVRDADCGFISMDTSLTSHGAAETVAEGRVYADFLEQNRGKYSGVILCLSNFGDEAATVAALKNCGVPILIQACPDEIGKMSFAERRDAFAGKLAITAVFRQYGLPFTLTRSHTVSIDSSEFLEELKFFAAVCRVAEGLRDLTVVEIGARITAFKSMRFDEIAAQRHGVTTETLDLSDFFLRMERIDTQSAAYRRRLDFYREYTGCSHVPPVSMDNLIRTSLAAEEVAAQYGADCLTIRCWDEFQRAKKVTVCSVLSELNERGIVAACELDLGGAIAMKALACASGGPAMCLDFNNNYGGDPDKCVLFHCGPVANSLMCGKGEIAEHLMIKKTMGDDWGWGVNKGAIRPMPFTFAGLKSEDGGLYLYTGQGDFTEDRLETAFFGTGGVAKIPELQKKLYTIAQNGFRHHVCAAAGYHSRAVTEACRTYLGYRVVELGA